MKIDVDFVAAAADLFTGKCDSGFPFFFLRSLRIPRSAGRFGVLRKLARIGFVPLFLASCDRRLRHLYVTLHNLRKRATFDAMLACLLLLLLLLLLVPASLWD
jgi:hypothetical protein